MKKMLFLLFPLFSFAQKNIVKVGVGEYFTSYLTDENKVYAMLWNNSVYNYVFTPFSLSNIVDVDGAQYTNIVLDNQGKVFVIGKSLNGGGEQITTYPNFSGNSKAYGWFQSYLTIKNDSIYYFGKDQLQINGGADISVPIKLTQPSGKKIAKVVVSDISNDIKALITVLTTDGTVWQYNRGSAAPVKINLPVTIDITAIGRACYIALTNTDMLAWGPYTGYVGLADGISTPTSVLSKWVGVKLPIKQLVGNWNTLHIIDANDHLFGAGDNAQGEIGNGKQLDWKGYTFNNAPAPFAWSWLRGQLMQAPVQIPGTFKNICTSNSIAFYLYAQDCNNNWYSWGRNKSLALGNGLVINNDAIYPDWGNIPAPTLTTPSVIKNPWPQPVFNPASILAPTANAGLSQCVNISTVNLSAAGSAQQSGAIATYNWTKISGTGGVITAPSSVNTTVTGLTTGDYIFRVSVTNNSGLTTTNDVTVKVNLPIFYSNLTSAHFTNNCPVGYTGEDIIYIVAAGKYTSTINQADADSKASADLSLNGQAWANANGKCIKKIIARLFVDGYQITVYSDGSTTTN